MILDDRHIEYLRLVNAGKSEVNQIVAAQMRALGATHIVSHGGHTFVSLTEYGKKILIEEDEAWG